MVQHFKYLKTTLTNQNSFQEENKNKLKSGNTCYHSAQNILSSSLLSKNTMIKIYTTIILRVVFYGWKTWSTILMEENRQRALENSVLRGILGLRGSR